MLRGGGIFVLLAAVSFDAGAQTAANSTLGLPLTKDVCPLELGFFQGYGSVGPLSGQPPFTSVSRVAFRTGQAADGALFSEAPGLVYLSDPSGGDAVEVTLERLYGDGTRLDGRYSRVASDRLDTPGLGAPGIGGAADFRYPPNNWETEDCLEVIEDCSPFDAVNVYYHIDRVAREFWLGRLGVDIPFQADVYPHISGDGAFSDPSRSLIKLGVGWIFMRNAAKEDEIIYHEYAHLAIGHLGFVQDIDTPIQAQALSEGYADYFTASFTNDPRIGEWIVTCPDRRECEGPPDDTEIRTLATNPDEWNWRGGSPATDLAYGICTRYHELDRKCKISSLNQVARYTWGMIWGGLLWDLRESVGEAVTDQLALEAVRYTDTATETFERAAGRLVEADQELFAGAHRGAIEAMASARGVGIAVDREPEFSEVPFSVSAYPVPAAGQIHIEIQMDQPGPFSVSAFDAQGRLVEQILSGNAGQEITSVLWNGTGHTPGPYFIRVSGPGGRIRVMPVVVAY
ncbi:MAG: hypothetical protein ACI80V_001937 [Rhodothermales bacterium]|jgi:hypothetical protein